MKNSELFREREIFTASMYVSGIYPAAKTETDVFVKRGNNEMRSVILPVLHGSAYVVRFGKTPPMLRCALCESDPRDLFDGEGIAVPYNDNLPFFADRPETDCADFMCVPKTGDGYLIICTGKDELSDISVTEYPILLGCDTDDSWFYAPDDCGDALGNADSWGDWKWNGDELIAHVYEPLREKYPDYITREHIGRDNTGKYDMWAYIFTPENYEQTLFITAGIHGDEREGFLGAARFIELMCTGYDARSEGMAYLRNKVRLVVIPMVNVWSTAEEKKRRNSSGVDLNRDFADHSQSETINVLWLLHKYRSDVSVLIDFHNSHKQSKPLYYQFSMQAANSAVSRKLVNHIWQRLVEKGWERSPADLTMIPGRYNKSNVYLQGYAYNHLGIPTIVVEHNVERWYELHSAESLKWAVECYGNCIIQTALAKIKMTEK